MSNSMKEIKEQGEKLREAMIDNIVEYIAIHGYPPTVREIGDMVGLKSTATTQHHMKILLKEGKIETDAGFNCPRAIRVPGYKFTKVAG